MKIREWQLSGAVVLVLLLVVGAAGCGTDAVREGAIVAEVGDRTIAMREVTDYITGLMIDFETPGKEYVMRRQRLRRLIEDELLIIGAYDRALDADIGILEQVDQEKDKFLLDELFRAEVLDKVTVEEAEVRELYDHFFDRVELSQILTLTKDAADSVMVSLQAGADFGDQAELHSQDPSTRLRGGVLGRPWQWGELPPPIQDAAWATEVGELAGPVETVFGWHVIKVTKKWEEPSLPFEELKAGLENRIRRVKQDERRVEHLESLKSRFDVEFDPEVLAIWRAHLKQIADTTNLVAGQAPIVRRENLPPEDEERILYRFDVDKEVTLGQFCGALQVRSPYEQPDADSLDELEMVAFGNSLFDVLHKEALRLKLDESDILRDRVREYQESLMADRMRGDDLVRGVRVTEEDVVQFFEANSDSFDTPTQYHVRELMVYDSLELKGLLARARSGEPMEKLTREYTKRPGMAAKAGDLGWLTPRTYPDYYELATEMKVGEVYGPIMAADQYSIIELLGTIPAQSRTLDEVRGVIFERLQKDRKTERLSAYFDSVQVQHPVVLHHEVLESGLGDVSATIDSLGTDWWRN